MKLEKQWNWIDDVKFEIDWQYRNIRGFFYSIYYGIQNLFVYFKLVWLDRDWDWIFLIKLMEFKFKRMEHQHRKYGICLNSPKCSHQLMVVKNLCHRLVNEDYCAKDWEMHEKKYGKRLLNKYHLGQTKSMIRISKKEDYMRNQDRDLLCKYIQKHLYQWWD